MAGKSNRKRKPSNQIVGNARLYYVCYELSKRGWNVLPTSRNTRGVDVVFFSEKAQRKYTMQVKSSNKKGPILLGSKLDNLFRDFPTICRKVFEEKPEIFIIAIDDLKAKDKDSIHVGVKNNIKSYWFQPKDYEQFRNNRRLIGDGYDSKELNKQEDFLK
ncbi:MAG: hypothetical protein DRI28_07175 [Caldiserica bacterium]|nr:MAG: hypothetical protein DRI28_07175 [Caldisericota bacterium]